MIENAIQIICVYAIPLIFAITLHEAAHGWAAKKLGDDTAWILGRVTANPVPHIDPVGTVLVPGALVLMSALTGGAGFVFGWAKPVPVNPNYFRKPKQGMAITALAGPISNILLAVLFLEIGKVIYLYAPYSDGMNTFFDWCLFTVAPMSVGMGLFNLIPIPPLDGSKVLFSLLPDRAYNTMLRYERYGMLLLWAVVLLGVGDKWMSAAIQWTYELFCRVVGF